MDAASIREWREAHGLSQTDLARWLGVEHNMVYRWERGRRSPPPGQVLDLALRELERRLSESI